MIDEATKATGGNDEKLKKLIPNQRAWQATVALGTTAHQLYTKTLNDMSSASGSTAKALEEYDKGAGDSIEKMKTSVENAGIALGTALAPSIESVCQSITSLSNAFQSLSPATKEFIGYSMAVVGGLATLGASFFMARSGLRALAAAFGIGKEAAAATTAIKSVAAVAGEAEVAMDGAAAVGTGALSTGLAGMAAAAAPWLIAGAAVAATGYTIYKGLQQQATPAVNLFADQVKNTSKDVTTAHGTMTTQITSDVVKISDSTKQAVGAYMDLDNNATASLTDLYTKGTTITNQTVANLVGQYDQMGAQIKSGMDKHYNDEYNTMQQFFSKSNAASKAESADVLASLQKDNANKKNQIDTYNNQIQDILQTASNNHRALTLDEQQKINAIQETMRTNAVNSLSDNETQAKVILQRLKDYGTNITAQQASEVIKNANNQRDGAVKAANDTYDKTVAEITNMRDQTHVITSDQADKLIADAKRQKDDSITHAEALRSGVVSKITDMNKNVSDSVDTTDGHILTEWDKLKTWWDNWNPVTKIFSFLISGSQQAASDPASYANAKAAVPSSTGNVSATPMGGHAYASGTNNAAEGWALVGENGPEFVNFSGGETVLNNSNTMALLSSNSPVMASGNNTGSQVYITVHVSGNIAKNERELGQTVAREFWNQTKMQGKF
jgi:phage-related tail protein